MAKNENDGDTLATPATSATKSTLYAPNSYEEAEAFAYFWLEAENDALATGWKTNFRVAWDDEGRFLSVTIEKEFVGFDIEKEVEKAIEALQYDKPIDESKSTILHVLWEKQRALESKAGRPTGSPWAGTIWTIAYLFRCCDFPLSRNPLSPEQSGFDAIASAMLRLRLAPNSYSGVKGNFYDFGKQNSLS